MATRPQHRGGGKGGGREYIDKPCLEAMAPLHQIQALHEQIEFCICIIQGEPFETYVSLEIAFQSKNKITSVLKFIGRTSEIMPSLKEIVRKYACVIHAPEDVH